MTIINNNKHTQFTKLYKTYKHIYAMINKWNQNNMKECDKRKKKHTRSNLHMIYISSNNGWNPVTKTFTPLHYSSRSGALSPDINRKGYEADKLPPSTAPNFGENRPGCFTMTTPPLTIPSSPNSFWRNIEWLSSSAHRTPLTWYPVTYSYFQK
jgi:hypothetical protein